MNQFEQPEEIAPVSPKSIGSIAFIVFLLIVALSAFISSATVVDAGEQGVVTHFGKIRGKTLYPGFHFVDPFVDRVTTFDTREQKKEVTSSAASSDLQTVNAKIAVNHHVDPDKINQLYQEVGVDFESRIVDPAVQESVKASTAQFTVNELITKRAEVKEKIKSSLMVRLVSRYIIVDDVSITNFDFSSDFNAAIEAKQVAQQQVQKAQQDLERIKIEAEQKVAQAQAEADAQKAQSQTITPEILQLRAIEKWNGVLPVTNAGQSVPFLNIPTPSK